MVGCAPSTSGRVLDGHSLGNHWQSLFFQSVVSSSQRRLSRSHRAVTCRAIALPNKLQLPLLKGLLHLFKAPEEKPVETLYVEVSPRADADGSDQKTPIGSFLKQATYAAIHVGLRLTGIAVRLAKTVVEDVKRSVRTLQVQQEVRRKAAEARKQLDADTLRRFESRRETLRLQGRDVDFMQMLHTLDRSHLDLEAKWALVQKHTADKADFSERLQHLYKAACDSKEAVETLLRPDASRAEVNRFWKSEQTAALIAEEESLKKLVFAQMLQGGAV